MIESDCVNLGNRASASYHHHHRRVASSLQSMSALKKALEELRKASRLSKAPKDAKDTVNRVGNLVASLEVST